MLKTLNFIRKLNKNKKSDLVKNFPLPGRKEKVTSFSKYSKTKKNIREGFNN
jgi:ribosomal protein S10